MKINKKYKITVILFFVISLVILFILLNPARKTPSLNILFITIDALRADHLGCYGYQRETSPNIDKLAAEGICFLNCFSVSCSTTHASPSLFTGQYLGVFSFDVLHHNYDNVLDNKFTTLAEYLKKLGYHTAAFINNGHYENGSGFEQGFEIYENLSGNAQAITNKIIGFLNNDSGSKPFFIWAHYIDAHSPYFFTEEYFEIFEKDKLYKENDKILKLNPINSSGYFVSKGYLPKIVFREGKYSLNYYIACYDAAIRSIDFNIGRLLKNIKRNTLIILTADHGESLGEHSTYFHHENLYDEVLHVPLIIKDIEYFKGGRKISKIVSVIDIVPTVLNRINPLTCLFDKNKFNGIDLKRILKDSSIKRSYIYFYFPGEWGVRDVNKNVKYILNQDRKEELYFMPDEYNNLINIASKDISSVRKRLRNNLKAWLKNYPIRSDINLKKKTLNKDVENNLKSLGYIQ